MNYKNKKLISKGFNNYVYSIKLDGNTYILKQYGINNLKKDYNLNLWRELDILNFIKKLDNSDKKYFMNLISNDIEKCNLKVNYFNTKSKTIAKKKYKKCMNIILSYNGKPISDLLKNKLLKSKKEKYNLIIQITYAINIFRKNGYIHNDMHNGNITFKKNNEIIKIKGSKFKPKYIYSLIDFGISLHKKYKLDSKYFNIDGYLKINFDLIHFVKNILLQESLLFELVKNKDHSYNFKMNDLNNLYKNHKQLWNKIKKKLLSLGSKYKRWYDIFESGDIDYFFTNENDFPMMKINGKNIFNLLITNQIKFLLSSYNRKIWLKINNWNIYLPNLIPSKDIEYITLNLTNNHKIIKYLINKN